MQLSGRLFLEGNLTPGRLTIADGLIASIEFGQHAPSGEQSVIIAPGFIDLHVHGFGGCDPLDDLPGMALALARAGTTTFQPTLFPREPAGLGADAALVWRAAGAMTGEARADPIGLHCEGPFLNPDAAGAIPVQDIVTPSVDGLRAILGSATGDGSGVKTMTIAPELAGASELIAELVRCGVRPSLGHSLSSAQVARGAARAGATGATHLFNAMSGVHHRDMGLAGFAMSDREIYAEIIGDLAHVHTEAFELALAARGPAGLCLVSDALQGAGTGCDVFHSHGREHIVKDGTAYYPGHASSAGSADQLAGSASSQLDMVRKLTSRGVCSLEDALTMASATPAHALGLDGERGRLCVGARADLVLLEDPGLNLRATYVAGHPVA